MFWMNVEVVFIELSYLLMIIEDAYINCVISIFNQSFDISSKSKTFKLHF